MKSEINEWSEQKLTYNETLQSWQKKNEILEKLKFELECKINAMSLESTKSNELYAKLLNAENKIRELVQENAGILQHTKTMLKMIFKLLNF